MHWCRNGLIGQKGREFLTPRRYCSRSCKYLQININKPFWAATIPRLILRTRIQCNDVKMAILEEVNNAIERLSLQGMKIMLLFHISALSIVIDFDSIMFLLFVRNHNWTGLLKKLKFSVHCSTLISQMLLVYPPRQLQDMPGASQNTQIPSPIARKNWLYIYIYIW